MNKKLLKTIAIAACSLTFVASLGFGVSNTLKNAPETVDAAEIVLDTDSTWLEDRDYNSVFTVPMGDIEGTRASTFVVVAPSGNAYNTEKVTLTETGKYTVTWYAIKDGKTVSAKKEFYVTKKTLELQGDASISASDSTVYPFPNEGSIHLNMREGATFTYNKAINLQELGYDKALLEVFPEKGIKNIKEAASKAQYDLTEDASVYFIKLTDAYDPTNVVTIQMAWMSGYYWTVYGNAVGQKAHSLYRTSKGTLQISSNAVTDHRYTLAYEPGIAYRSYNMSQEGLSFYYDNETNQIFVRATRWYAANGTTILEGYSAASKRLVADLSNELIYPGNTFKGFTTGEVYLSITPAGFGATGEANLDIVNIGNDKMSLDMLNTKEKDTTKPVLQETHDFAKYNKIALGEEISVPEVIALDMAVPGGIVADAKVYFNGSTITLKNGKFTPTLKGKYTIVYTAKDPSGNTTTKSVEVICSDEYDEAVSLAISGTSFEVDAGSRWNVPECTISGWYNDTSAVKVYADGKLLEDKVLFVDHVKNYKLEYVYETPFKTYTVECDVQANPSDEVVFSTAYLPEYFIAGASYTLDAVMAQEFSAEGLAPYVADTYMKVNGGEYTKVNYKNVTIPNASTVQFKYAAANGKFMETEAIKVVDVGFGGNLQKKDYFQSEDPTFTKASTSSSTTYTMKSGSTMKYVNPVSLSNFKIDFLATNVDSVKFTLVDYYDRDKTLSIELVHSVSDGDKAIEIFINGISVKKVIGTTFLGTQTVVAFALGAFEITTGNILTGPFEWDANFTSDRALVWVTMKNFTADEMEEGEESTVTTGTPTIDIRKFYGNKFTNGTSDDSTPMLSLSLNYKGYQEVGKEIVIPKLIVTDLYTPFLESNLTLQMTDPDASYVKSVDGVALNGNCPVDRDYTVVLNRLGRFKVLFYYTENGTKTPYDYACNVSDSVAPTIVVADRTEGETLKASYRVKVAVANYTVSDDVTNAADIKSCIYVMYPSGLMKEVVGGKTFDTTEKGLYYVTYLAFDEFGNIATFIYKILVS